MQLGYRGKRAAPKPLSLFDRKIPTTESDRNLTASEPQLARTIIRRVIVLVTGGGRKARAAPLAAASVRRSRI
jgi:hypothetical protein